ncbi:MAG TPA: protein-disulfide reductase DsbD domain-containing protein, partial [Rhizomicrobium sp.]
MKRLLLTLAIFLAAAPAFGDALPPSGAPAKVHARLVAEDTAITPGGTVTVALEEKIAPGWHTYWKNPGDAGAPTTIDWTLPAGWKADVIQ